MILETIVTLGSMLLPPVIDIVKKKWIKPSADSPEATMSALATTNPEALGTYVNAMAAYLQAQTQFFNRDVVGTPDQWVTNIRAAIRPIGVIICIMGLVADTIPGLMPLDAGTRIGMIGIVGNWFGSKLVQE